MSVVKYWRNERAPTTTSPTPTPRISLVCTRIPKASAIPNSRRLDASAQCSTVTRRATHRSMPGRSLPDNSRPPTAPWSRKVPNSPSFQVHVPFIRIHCHSFTFIRIHLQSIGPNSGYSNWLLSSICIALIYYYYSFTSMYLKTNLINWAVYNLYEERIYYHYYYSFVD